MRTLAFCLGIVLLGIVFLAPVTINVTKPVTINVTKPQIQDGNMNGLYEIANPNTQSRVSFSTDYSKKGAEYFDVYSEKIKTVYGEVFWKMMDPQPLPQSIVNRFNNKTMALIGYEVDQVFEGDVSVPIYWSYNHHFEFWLLGNFMNTDESIPNSIHISEGNGGEYRKSFHGYPKGYAQLIKSPTQYQVQPMQIDTHNRDYQGPGFKAGILPKSSLAPPDATYSGLLECPCTTRLTKEWSHTYSPQFNGICPTVIVNSSTCFSVVTLFVQPTQELVVSDPLLPTGCVVINTNGNMNVLFNTLNNSNQCFTGNKISGAATSVVKLSVLLDTTITGGQALITITGPINVWFGVGFDADSMEDKPYVVVVDGNGVVSEHKIGDHTAGSVLTPTQVTVVSSTVENGFRTVVLSRGFAGITEDHYTFTLSNSIHFISAIGRTSHFDHHQSKGSTILNFITLDRAICICDDGISGNINGISFSKNCTPEPMSELLSQNNSVCRIQTYGGGLLCCLHEYILLDADQPVDPRTDEIQLKFRIWYQEYQPATTTNPNPSHINLRRFYFQTEAWAGEYDVPQCAPGTPSQECVHQITSRFKVKDTFSCPQEDMNCPKEVNGIKILYAGGHCHAPSCISIELYNSDTGALICRQVPLIGTGSSNKFDELDFMNIAPCLWGSPDEGLITPPLLSLDTKLMSIKRCNSTYGHYGEMASWQMRGIFV